MDGNKYTKFTTNHPLKTSIIKTIVPAALPKTRNVFVAPALPLPCCLISILKKLFPTINAEGKAPVR